MQQYLDRTEVGTVPQSPMSSRGQRRVTVRDEQPERTFVPKTYGRIGNLEVRLARSRDEIRLAQRLRYQVFFEELHASAGMLARFRRLDQDAFDPLCDHLLVVDLEKTKPRRFGQPTSLPHVAGTYRIMRQAVAERHGGFYTAREFDIANLLATKSPRYSFMEVGRSCVLAPYRNKRSVELLWHGIWTYVRENNVDVMIGCASFEGTDPHKHAAALSFLHHNYLAPPEWRCRAHAGQFQSMNFMAKEAIDPKAALRGMPPLIKGYMRLGAYVGEGAVIDHAFNTTDVMIILPIENIDPRYFEHYGAPGETRSRIASGA